MLTLKKTQIIPSATVPGVSYEVHTVTHGRRFEIEALLEGFQAKARELIGATASLTKAKDASNPDVSKALTALHALELTERAPLLIRQVLIAVHGVDPGTVEEFLELAPADLVEEAYGACKAAYGLSPDQQKNSESPSITHSQGQGETNDTTV